MVPGLRVGGGLGSVAVPWLPPSVSWHAADARRPVHVGNAAGRRACEGRTAAQFQGQTYFGYPNRTGLAAFWVPDPNGALTTIFVQGGPGGVQSETLLTIGSVYRSSTNDCHFQIQSITTHT